MRPFVITAAVRAAAPGLDTEVLAARLTPPARQLDLFRTEAS